jgi:hypothetical protein
MGACHIHALSLLDKGIADTRVLFLNGVNPLKPKVHLNNINNSVRTSKNVSDAKGRAWTEGVLEQGSEKNILT